jgi:hypothetical protein
MKIFFIGDENFLYRGSIFSLSGMKIFFIGDEIFLYQG